MRIFDVATVPGHAGLVNVGVDDHHDRPEVVEYYENSKVIAPQPFGPISYDIVIPDNASVLQFMIESVHVCAEGGGRAGVLGYCNDNSIRTAALSRGGHGTLTSTAYNAFYAKSGGASYLSHKVFDNTGDNICLGEAYITTISGPQRVFRTFWYNFSASNQTLEARFLLGILG